MITVFGNESEFRPITKNGITIPYYYISKDGRALSTRTREKILKPKHEFIEKGTNYKPPRQISGRVNRLKNPELFKEYEFTQSQQKLNVPGSKYYKRLTKDPNLYTINVKYHRAVMEAWKPIDEYPPIPKEDWDKCPETAKEFMRKTAIIDHIDSDTRNNHVDNLRWCTPHDNQWHRKAAEEEHEG